MRAGRIALGAAACLAVAGICLAASVTRDYDKNADFSKFKSYYWAKPVNTGNPLSDQRIVAAIDTQLQAKGWKKAEEGQGDAAIAANASAKEQVNMDTYYTGTGWGWRGGGMATTQVTSYTVGTLVIDIFDAGSKQLVWRGTASDTISDKPEKNEKTLAKAMQKLFGKFPPEPAKK